MPSIDPLIGLLTPMQRDGARDFAVGSGAVLSASKVRQSLGVMVGELPWRTRFGSKIPGMRFGRSSDAVTSERIRVQAVDALAMWAPSVTIQSVEAERLDTTVVVRVVYREDGVATEASLSLMDQ